MTSSEQVEFDPTANGGPGLHGDAEIIAAMEAQSAAVRARAEQLKAELEKITPELKRYDKAIAALRGEPLGHPQKAKRPGRPPGMDDMFKKKVSDETVARTWEAIERLTGEGGQDEFTQAQVRAITGDKSSSSSLAFEALRQDGKIRFARQQGNSKFFRLTHAQVEAAES